VQKSTRCSSISSGIGFRPRAEGEKADHGWGWVYWFLAGKFPGQAFGRRDYSAEEASDRVERFHRGSVPYVETSCKDFYSERSSMARDQDSGHLLIMAT
jgi:hypothetical protein